MGTTSLRDSGNTVQENSRTDTHVCSAPRTDMSVCPTNKIVDPWLLVGSGGRENGVVCTIRMLIYNAL